MRPFSAFSPGTATTLILLALAVWLYPVGRLWLDPGDDFLVRQAPLAAWVAHGGEAGVHPLGPAAMPSDPFWAVLAGRLGGDPLGTWQLLTALPQVLALLVLAGGLRAAAGASLPAVLGAAMVFFGEPTAWLVTASPEEAAAHLLGAGAVAAGLAPGRAGPGVALLLGVAAGVLVPPLGWVLVPALVVVGGRRTGPWPAAVALAVLWRLGGGPGGDRGGPTGWLWLLPLAGWVACRRRCRPVLLLLAAELFGRALGGWSEAMSGALPGAVGVALGVLVGETWQGLSGDRRPALAAAHLPLCRLALAVLVAGFAWQGGEPAETVLNRRVFLEARARGVAFARLLLPGTLSAWAAGPGRTRGLTAGDLELAQRLPPGAGVVLTPAVSEEPLIPAAVLAALSGRRLLGWHADPEHPELLPAAAAAQRLGNPSLLAGPAAWVALRKEGGVRVLSPLVARVEGQGELRVEAPSRWIPGELVWLEPRDDLPAGWRWGCRVFRGEHPWGELAVEVPAGQPLPLVVPGTPGTYRLAFYGRRKNRMVELGDGGVAPFRCNRPAALASLQGHLEGLEEEVPAGTILKVRLVVANPGEYPVSLERLPLARVSFADSRAPQEAAWDRPVLLPGEEAACPLLLATPRSPGKWPLAVELLDGRGRPHRLSVARVVRTRRLLPPVRAIRGTLRGAQRKSTTTRWRP